MFFRRPEKFGNGAQHYQDFRSSYDDEDKVEAIASQFESFHEKNEQMVIDCHCIKTLKDDKAAGVDEIERIIIKQLTVEKQS